jgi:hypothetical protein
MNEGQLLAFYPKAAGLLSADVGPFWPPVRMTAVGRDAPVADRLSSVSTNVSSGGWRSLGVAV